MRGSAGGVREVQIMDKKTASSKMELSEKSVKKNDQGLEGLSRKAIMERLGLKTPVNLNLNNKVEPLESPITMLTLKNISAIFNRSEQWVYNHSRELGGFKIGGSLFFTLEGLEDAIQRKRSLAGSGDDQEKENRAKDIQIEARRRRMGATIEGEAEKYRNEAAERHGFGDILRSVS